MVWLTFYDQLDIINLIQPKDGYWVFLVCHTDTLGGVDGQVGWVGGYGWLDGDSYSMQTSTYFG